MSLFDKLLKLYPTLSINDFDLYTGTIVLQNDSDGKGDYIKKWNHPALTEPSQEQINKVI